MKNKVLQSEDDYRTFGDYVVSESNPTKKFLMISELIDNSISSMDNQFSPIDWNGEKLTVTIEINMTKSENSNQIYFDRYEVNNDAWIRVVDDAYGMDDSVLVEAMRWNKRNAHTRSQMNRFGRGLKQSGFFFGLDLLVQTRDFVSACESKLTASDASSLDDKIKIVVTDSNYGKRGTSVTIRKIHKKAKFTLSSVTDLVEAIGHRYIKYLSKKKTLIKVTFIDEKGVDQSKSLSEKGYLDENGFIEPFEEVKALMSSVSFNKREGEDKKIEDFTKEKTSEIIESVHSKILALALESGRKEDGKMFDEKVALATWEKISNLIKMAAEKKNTTFSWVQVIPVLVKSQISGKLEYVDLKVEFWRIANPAIRFIDTKKTLPHTKNKEYRGFRVYEGERAILHPKVKEGLDTKTYLKHYDERGSGSTNHWFAGSFEINAVGKTKNDKSTPDIDPETEYDLNEKLFTVWKVYDTFLIESRDYENSTAISLLSQSEKNVLSSLVKEFKLGDANIQEFDFSAKSEIYDNWKINISLENDPKLGLTIQSKMNKEEKVYEMVMNLASPLLKDFFEKCSIEITDKRQFAYRLALTFVHIDLERDSQKIEGSIVDIGNQSLAKLFE